MTVFLFITGCQTTLVVKQDSEWLLEALNETQAQLALRGNVTFETRRDERSEFSIGSTPQKGYVRFELKYPQSTLVNVIDAWKKKHLVVDSNLNSTRIFMRIEKVQYGEFRSKFEGSQAWIRVNLEAVLINDKGNILHHDIYDSGMIKSKSFPRGIMQAGYGDTYQEIYSRTLYIALLASINSAIKDLASKQPNLLVLKSKLEN